MKTKAQIKKYYGGGGFACRVSSVMGDEELKKILKLLNKKPHLVNFIIKKYQHLF